MTIEQIKQKIVSIVCDYPISRIVLFGSRANNTNRADSDVDLMIEFSAPVSLLTLAAIKLQLEELLELEVDVVHGPLQETDLIEISEAVEIYAA